MDQPRSTGKAKLFIIPEFLTNSIQEESFLSFLEVPLNYGDVIQPETAERDDRKYLWNGSTFVPLARDLDSSGHLPSSFQVITNGYPPDYWTDVINHNVIVWMDFKVIRSQLLDHYQTINEATGFISHFVIGDVTYYLTNGEIPKDHICWHGGITENDFILFNSQVKEEIYLSTIQKGDIIPIEFSLENPRILHLI
ncbi:Hypothetical protein POVR1_LOCUS3 [uncultured virus]|nr:Hypothetical protein POVR1_LOCUS3 [uncultured virus]